MSLGTSIDAGALNNGISRQEVFERVVFGLAGLGFFYDENETPKNPAFAIVGLREHVLYKDDIEILAIDDTAENSNELAVRICIAAPLEGPIEGFSPYWINGKKMWGAGVYISKGESAQTALQRIEQLVRKASVVCESQKDAVFDRRTQELNERIDQIELDISAIRRVVNPIVMGALLGFFAGDRFGEQGCGAERDVPSKYGVSHVDTDQKPDQLYAKENQRLDAVISGMVQGVLAGSAISLVSILQARRRRKQK